MNKAIDQRKKRQVRTRAKLRGTQDRPRISVHKSNRFMFVQLIDDEHGKTLIGLSERHIEGKLAKIEKAKQLGVQVAQKAKALKVTKAIFDRGGYSYHGKVKALAEGAREGGLEF